MSELSSKKETFIDAYNLLESAKRMTKKAIVDIVREIADYDGYIGFNDETSFPNFYDDEIGEIESVVGVRVRKTEGGEDELQFCTDAVYIDNEDAWFCPFDYGEVDLEVLFNCVTDYAEINEID